LTGARPHRTARTRAVAALAAAVCITGGCRARHDAAEHTVALAIETSGCAAVRVDGTCEVDRARDLRVFTRAPPDARIDVRSDGAPIASVPTPVDGGVRLALTVPARARAIEITAAGGGTIASARIAIAEREHDPIVDALEEKRRAGDAGQIAIDDAALTALPPGLQARALDIVARSELSVGHAAAAAEKLSAALALHRAAGSLSGEVHDAFALAYVRIMIERRFADARALLAETRVRARGYPHGLAEQPYYEGMLAAETGDFRGALTAFREAEIASTRIGRTEQLALIERTRVLVLLDLGRFEEARERLARARADLPADAPPCQRAHVLTNAGWTALRIAEEREDQPGHVHDVADEKDAEAALDGAIALYDRACPNRAFLANARLNMGRLALLRGDLPGVLAQVAAREGLGDDPRTATFWADLEGRAALSASKPSDALRHFDREAGLAASADLGGAAWRAALGRAEALEALGRIDESLAAYARAEELASDQSLLVPMTEGRESFVGGRALSARMYVERLLRRNDARKAFDVARRARARALSTLRFRERAGAVAPRERAALDDALAAVRTERAALDSEAADDWKLSSPRLAEARAARAARREALAGALDRALSALGGHAREGAPPPIPPGDVVLLVHPLRDGYAVFAADHASVAVRTIAAWPADAALGDALLAPFDAMIARASRVRVLAYGPSKRVDLHALTWRGAPLVTAKPVVYGVDVGPAADPPDAAEGTRGAALVVADPRGDLGSARAEAADVAPRLGALLGSPAEVLEGEAATHAAVTSLLGAAPLFHYAGHARYADAGWGSALVLAGSATLGVPDVLALPRAPDLVVLAGCETARSDDDIAVESIGLSEAFVLAGARAVVAAARPIDDALARAVVRDVYAADDMPKDLPAALAGAEAAALRRAPASDWASFRVVVP